MQSLGLSNRMTKEWLELHYITNQEPASELARLRGTSEATIRYHLHRWNIPIRYRKTGSIRNHKLADARWLRSLYVNELRSLQEVADLAGCRVGSVRNALSRHGITRRRHPRGKYTSQTRLFIGRTRRLILERDGYRCRWPDCSATEPLEINHIIPLEDGGRTTVDNAITLCRPHHRAIRKREHDFVELFRGLISLGPLT
jgi:5-methylcytosine-specific restriction endonuclease McrA